MVINLTDEEPEPAAVTILIKGPNYAHTPKSNSTIKKVFGGVGKVTSALSSD
jgi:hypothetical protein